MQASSLLQGSVEIKIKKEMVYFLLDGCCDVLVSGNPLNEHVFLCVDNKVTPFKARNQQLALDLPKVCMRFSECMCALTDLNVWAVHITQNIRAFNFYKAKLWLLLGIIHDAIG